MNHKIEKYHPDRCAVVLSEGGKWPGPNGDRFQKYSVPEIAAGWMNHSSMEETPLPEAGSLLPPNRLFTVLNYNRLQGIVGSLQYPQILRDRIIPQPQYKGTGPELFLALLYVNKYFPQSVTVLFSSKHMDLDETEFKKHVDKAFRIVEQNSSLIVLLGVEPLEHKDDCSYIRLAGGKRYRPSHCVMKVKGFVENPSFGTACGLLKEEAVLNASVMAFKTRNVLKYFRNIYPGLYQSFFQISNVIGTSRERQTVEKVYRKLKPSQDLVEFLEKVRIQYPSRLWVWPIREAPWHGDGWKKFSKDPGKKRKESFLPDKGHDRNAHFFFGNGLNSKKAQEKPEETDGEKRIPRNNFSSVYLNRRRFPHSEKGANSEYVDHQQNGSFKGLKKQTGPRNLKRNPLKDVRLQEVFTNFGLKELQILLNDVRSLIDKGFGEIDILKIRVMARDVGLFEEREMEFQVQVQKVRMALQIQIYKDGDHGLNVSFFSRPELIDRIRKKIDQFSNEVKKIQHERSPLLIS